MTDNVKELSLNELVKDYDIVSTTGDAIIVQERVGETELADPSVGLEYGSTASSHARYMTEEYNSELVGISGLRVYDRMMRSDAATRSSLRVMNTPITGGSWFVDPASSSVLDKRIADFVENNLFDGMTYSWDHILNEALKMLGYGFYMFEKVWQFKTINGQRRVVLKKLGSRHPLDVEEIVYDRNGGPNSVRLYVDDSMVSKSVPIEKLVVFTYDQQGGDIRGLSLLRSAYKHWYFKENAYKIDAIQKERHGIGVPVIKLPLGATKAHKEEASELASNLRTNERAHAVLPYGFEIMFAKIEGQPVSALETADHHSRMIFQNVLGQAMWNTGGAATDADQSMALFYKSTRQIANLVLNTMNMFVIPQLVRFNWDVEKLPKLRVRGLGDTSESREISFALRNFVGAEIITVDDRLEAWARTLIDAPDADPSTKRRTTLDAKVESMDSKSESDGIGEEGGSKGQPNQSKASGMSKGNKGSSSEGEDRSGTV